MSSQVWPVGTRAGSRCEAFRSKWAAHNVRFHDAGTKRLHHPIVGDLELTYEAMELSADTGLVMFAYTAEPGTKIRASTSTAGKLVSNARRARNPHHRPSMSATGPITALGLLDERWECPRCSS